MVGGRGDERRYEAIALLVIIVLAALAIASLLVAFSYYCYIRSKVSKRRLKSLVSKDYSAKSQDLELGRHQPPPPPPAPPINGGKIEATAAATAVGGKGVQVFSYKQLHSATGGFSKGNVVGHGSFGSVYKGVLGDGRKIAVKLMDRAGKQGEEEFGMEVELLTRLSSPYLLGLVGYCTDSCHRMLVYEYMANGGLQEHLYPTSGSHGGVSKLSPETGRTLKSLPFLCSLPLSPLQLQVYNTPSRREKLLLPLSLPRFFFFSLLSRIDRIRPSPSLSSVH